MRSPLYRFLIVCVMAAAGLAGYLLYVKSRLTDGSTSGSRISTTAQRAAPVSTNDLLFRYTAVDDHYGKLAAVDRADRRLLRFLDPLSCDVVHFAGGRGICLTATRGVLTTYAAEIFDADARRRVSIPLRGEPSRCRMSPDGTLAAFTVFVSGHSYTSLDFSTETALVDAATGATLANVEAFQVTRDGRPFHAKDFNFWGVSFTPDSKRFYCTLSTNNERYLVAGDIATRTATVVHQNVECPSVSPDGLRIAYKKRFAVNGRIGWQLQILDLATMTETPLMEKRSVDDQLEWLDNSHVLYAVSENPTGSSASTDVWTADADGASPPALYLPKAYSPVVVR